jgi:hypothetical protein
MRILEELSPGDAGTSPVAAKISAGLDDPGQVFVFPTQISADSWAKASLDFSGRTCVDLDRFQGWDKILGTLRQRPSSPGLREADSQSRLLWAYRLIKEESKNHLLGRLLNRRQVPPSGLACGLASAAPFLFEAAASLRAKISDGSLPDDQGLIQDYESLAADYSSFLRKNGIYEPGRLPWRGDPDKRYLLFYPSLMPGFSPELSRSAPDLRIETWEPDMRLSERGLLSFSTLPDQLDFVLGLCRNLIDQGLSPSDLALSLPDLGADMEAHLSRASRSWGLPLQYRGGRKLSDSPVGRLLGAAARALGEGFSLRSLKILFDPGLAPWKERQQCLSLIRIARRYRIPDFSADPEYMTSLWAKTLGSQSGQDEALSSFFSLLRRSCAALSNSRSFAALRIALHAFIDDLLDEEKFSTYSTLTLERIFEELSALESWETSLALEKGVLNPFEVFQAALQHRLYSPKDPAQAIAVYPYHLGIMIPARMHFVLEASMESSRAALQLLSRAPQEISPSLDEAALTDALFDSMNLTKTVFCFAEQSLDGYGIAHPYFFRHSARRIDIAAEMIPASPESAETGAWERQNASCLPVKLPRLSLEAAKGDFKGSGQVRREAAKIHSPHSTPGLPPPLFFDAARSATREPGPKPRLKTEKLLRIKAFDASPSVKLSPRALGYLALCPFRWFASGIPDLEEEIADPAVLAEGSLMHDMIRSLLGPKGVEAGSGREASENRQNGGATPPSVPSQSSLDEKIEDAFKRALQKILKRNGYSLQIALESAYPKIRDRIRRIIEYESVLEEQGWGRSDFERVLSMELPDLGLKLEGRADRVMFKTKKGVQDSDLAARPADAFAQDPPPDSGCLLVDYKRKRCPTKKEFLVDESGRIQDYQISSYAAMLESAGYPVLEAFYWSIEENKPVAVFGSGKQRPDRTSFEPERLALGNALAEASERIRKGMFLEIAPSKQACGNCPFRAVCRIHFSAERS